MKGLYLSILVFFMDKGNYKIFYIFWNIYWMLSNDECKLDIKVFWLLIYETASWAKSLSFIDAEFTLFIVSNISSLEPAAVESSSIHILISSVVSWIDVFILEKLFLHHLMKDAD